MEHASQSISKPGQCFYLYCDNILVLAALIHTNLAQISQPLLYAWHRGLLLQLLVSCFMKFWPPLGLGRELTDLSGKDPNQSITFSQVVLQSHPSQTRYPFPDEHFRSVTAERASYPGDLLSGSVLRCLFWGSAERASFRARKRGPPPRLDIQCLLSSSTQRASPQAQHRGPPLGLGRLGLPSGLAERVSSQARPLKPSGST